jgi:FdhD protein
VQESNKRNDLNINVKSKESFDVIRCYKGSCYTCGHELVAEEPLLIRIDDHPYSAVMRTPGEESFHAVGFCLAEGIIDNIDDLVTIGFCEDMDPNVVDIRLKPERREKVSGLLKGQDFISRTSCGICGKTMIEEMFQLLTPVADGTEIELDWAIQQIEKLPEIQQLRKNTRGSHAAVLLDSRLEILSMAEDVGRHNALDKAIGKLLMRRKLSEGFIGIISSRISYEMVQKANRAGIGILLSASRPTVLAVNLGLKLNMTLACIARKSELIIFCGEERIKR